MMKCAMTNRCCEPLKAMPAAHDGPRLFATAGGKLTRGAMHALQAALRYRMLRTRIIEDVIESADRRGGQK